ncbi:Alpha/beta hydrolase fold-1 [Trinorchestia longiramus]|nr:Alpha/beta hydrolase fold-1 [Trinorchestia longiramus]
MYCFGRSSRPTYSRDPLIAEDELVESLEAWRKVVGIDRFIVLGHSLGAYIATVYAFKYPHRIVHLVLEDAWGFPQQIGRYNNNSLGVMTMWVLSHFVPPLFLMRWLGPLGHWYVRWKPPFETQHFARVTADHQKAVYEYFYHSNARNPTGEVAFHSLMQGVAWARFPLIKRIHTLRGDVPITFLHGQLSWVSKKTSYKVKELRKDSFVDVKIIADAGHVIHSDSPDVFNATVNEILTGIDDGSLPSSSAEVSRAARGRSQESSRSAGTESPSKEAQISKSSSSSSIFAHSGMIAHIIADAGHVIHSDSPDVFNATVNEILTGIDDGSLPSSSAEVSRAARGRSQESSRSAGTEGPSKEAQISKSSSSSSIFAHSGMIAHVCQPQTST